MANSSNDDLDFLPIVVRGIEEPNGQWSYGSLTQKQIKCLNTPFLAASLRLYNNFAAFKVLPHGKGTMDERSTVLEILKILQSEENAFTAWEMEKNRKK